MAELDPTSIDLPTLAALAGDAATRHLLEAVRAAHPGIRPAHGYLFQRLVDGQPTVGELADALGISQQAVSKSVAELESLGYVERRVDAADSRARRVALTTRGRSALAAARTARAELEAELGLTPAEVAAARSALVRLLEATGGLDAVRGRRAPLPDH